MPRALVLMLCSTVAFGQAPRREPFDAAIQAYSDARASGDFDTAATRREEARSLLAQAPLSSPQFLGRVQNMAQTYQGSGRRVQARAVIQEALSRADSLGQSHPIRIQLLNTLADYWQQDGNLLKAVGYREKALAALESAPAPVRDSPQRPELLEGSSGLRAGDRMAFYSVSGARVSGRPPNNSYLYQQLAELYRQLGRPEAAAKAMEKMRALIQDDPRQLAGFYARQGDIDQAVAIYRKQSAQAAANPEAPLWDVAGPLQSIAGLYQEQQRWEDAAATLRQAVSLAESSGRPEARNQVVGMRLHLAHLLQQGGQSRSAEQIYEALLADTASDVNGQQIQVLDAYANQLSATKRAVQAEEMLKGYLSNHTLLPHEELTILFALSRMADSAGQRERAEEYRRAAAEKQRAMQPQQSPDGPLIGADLQKAHAAANQGNLDEAVELSLRVLGSAAVARDREQVTWQVPSIAAALASRKAPEMGDRLYRQLLPLLETWSVDNATLLTQALQQYARFLIGQKDRWGEVPAVIERYRGLVTANQGAESNEVGQAIQLRIEFERAREARAEAVKAAEELLAFEESLSGTTSQSYMRVAQIAADTYQFAGNPERAIGVYRQIVAIADLTFPSNDVQRAFPRMNAAFALANARQFEDAERLAGEAVALSEHARPPQGNMFTQQVEQIRRMKTAPESGRAPNGGVRGVAVFGTRWFTLDGDQK